MAARPDAARGPLRPALELAWRVARQGASATPPVVPPRLLRPVLHHAKLQPRTLATVREALDRDEAFRRRVAAEASEADLGPVAHSWLTRADGWEDDLRRAEAADAEAAGAVVEERAERQARRRLHAAEARRAEAEAEADRLRTTVGEAEAELAGARQQRRAAEDEVAGLTAAARTLTETVGELEAALTEAARSRRELEQLLDDAHRRIDQLLSERDAARAEAERADAAARTAHATLGLRQGEDADLRRALGSALDEAATAAQVLGAALGSAAGLLQGTPAPPPIAEQPAGGAYGSFANREESVGEPAPVRSGAPAGRPETSPKPRAPSRRPTELPPGVYDDAPEAAAHLVGVPGMVLAVDGYNVTLLGWPDEDLARQRAALLDRLGALAARTGVEARVFFDGDEHVQLPSPRGRPRDNVRVSFSAAGTDADEDIIGFVDALPAGRPVTVATNDRRVVDEVARRGANVVGSGQLLALLGRSPGGPAAAGAR